MTKTKLAKSILQDAVATERQRVLDEIVDSIYAEDDDILTLAIKNTIFVRHIEPLMEKEDDS